MDNRRKRRLFGAALLAGLLLTAGIAYASIPGPDGVIHGCYKTGNPNPGSVIVIDHTASCPSGYIALNWNQTGPQGPAGPQGPPGVSGYQMVTATATVPSDDVTAGVSIACPEGKRVLGGGSRGNNWTAETRITEDWPFVLGEDQVFGWRVVASGHVNNGAPWGLTGWAICATVAT